MTILYRSYAKINLYLDVLSRRDDGYHAIETIFQSVSLCDTITCETRAKRITLAIEGADLSTGEDNLVYKAAMLLRETYEVEKGARITLTKNIPIAAGLAGGSGNAAATLVALNELWGVHAPIHELKTLAEQLGSDVPFCVTGGTQAGTGRGEILTPIPPIPETWMILAHPPIAVSTPEMYNHPKLFKSGAVPGETGMSSRLQEAIRRYEEAPLGSLLFNAMEFAAVEAYPIIEEYKARLRVAGCDGVLMSGSGPTVFGVCANEDRARAAQEQLGEIRTTLVHSVNHGVEQIDD